MSASIVTTGPMSITSSTPKTKKSFGVWMLMACYTCALVQLDRFFYHADGITPTLLLAPGCLLPLILRYGSQYTTAAAFGAFCSMFVMPWVGESATFGLWFVAPFVAIGFAWELWFTGWLLKKWKFRQDLSRGKDPLLLILASLLATLGFCSTILPLSFWPTAPTTWKFLQSCLTWWLMHFASILVFTPAWLTFSSFRRIRTSEIWTLVITGVVTLACTCTGFELWMPMSNLPNPLIYLGLPIFILAPLTFGIRGASVVTVITCLASAYATSKHVGPFDHLHVMEANFALNLFLVTFPITTYSVGSYVSERRELLEHLAVGNSLMEKAEEIAGVGSWQLHPRTRYEQWSDQLYRILGLMPNEIPASIENFQNRFVIDEDRAWFTTVWNDFIHFEKTDRLEFRIRRMDGQIRHISAQANIQRDERGEVLRFVGAIRDITQRRRAMEERERMQSMLNKSEEIAHLGSWEIDSHGNMLRWSENMYRICGIRPGEFGGSFETFLRNFVEQEDRDSVRLAYQQVLQDSNTAQMEFRLLRQDGAQRFVHSEIQAMRHANGQLLGCYGTTSDITERKLVERQLLESEQRYRTLAENSSDMIMRLRPDGTIVYASAACRKILGYQPEDLIHRAVLEIILPADQERCRESLLGQQAGEDRLSLPYRGVRKDQTEVWLETKAQRIVDPLGNRELLCVTRDITERRNLEDQVAQAQRLEAIGRLAGGIAHDFNNILTVINGYAEILETRFSPQDTANKYVANILEAGRRAAQLTRQLLTYSRRQLVTRGQIHLNDVIHKLEPLLRPLMGEEIELIFRLDSELGLVEGDVGQFEQLLMNLAINARDAMPEGGSLTLQTQMVTFDPWEIRPPKITPGKYIRLIVADTGMGMDESVRQRLFEPFFTTKAAGVGTGLGLATVYATVEQSQGSITVESSVGVGTRFELIFPCREPAAEKHHKIEPLLPPPRPQISRRILVVEDDPNVRALVEQALKESGYDVRAEAEGESAIATATTAQPPFDLLLTDVVMKGLNGREVADRIREQSPLIPVIFMSGHTDDLVLRRGILNDELTLLQKPFTSSQLLQRIHQVFAGQAS